MSNPEYIVFCSGNSDDDKLLSFKSSDPFDDDCVKTWDQKLHRTLTEIFTDFTLTSNQIKELLRAPSEKHTFKISIFELILEQEPAFGKLFQEKNQLSLLWIAVLSGYQDSAELLLRSGTDVNEVYGMRATVHWFHMNEKSTILHALLQMYPSEWNERFIGLVIEHGADVNAKDCDGTTPLLLAARSSKADKLLPLLMRHGAHVDVKSNTGKNALHFLSEAPAEHTDLAGFLIEKGVSLHERDDIEFQLINLAALHNKNELVKFCLNRGADVNATALYSWNPLFLVARRQCTNPELLLTLLKGGADIDQAVFNGGTALHAACEEWWLSSPDFSPNSVQRFKIKTLLVLGANMFARDDSNVTPFDCLLDPEIIRFTTGRMMMLKTLALRKASLQPSVELEGEMMIKEKYPEYWKYYEDCIDELRRAKFWRFIETCTVLDILSKCQCQIAPLMRHLEFENRFTRMFYLDYFPIYAEEIVEAFVSAKSFYESMLEKEDIIDETLSNVLPYVVARKIASYTYDKCEICKLKETVNKARGSSRTVTE